MRRRTSRAASNRWPSATTCCFSTTTRATTRRPSRGRWGYGSRRITSRVLPASGIGPSTAATCATIRALMLDADEALTPAALTAISVAIRTAPPSAAAYLLCRRNWFSGQFLRYADGFPVWIMRLVRRGRARFVDSGHGEVPLPPVDGNVARINEPFLHYPFSHGLSQWVERHNAYSTREALLEHHHGAKQCWCDVFDRDGPRRRRALRNLARGRPCGRCCGFATTTSGNGDSLTEGPV